MTAKEARKNAEDFIEARNMTQLSQILKEVKDKSMIGLFEFTYFDEISSEVREDLLIRGLNISLPDRTSRDGEVDYIISW